MGKEAWQGLAIMLLVVVLSTFIPIGKPVVSRMTMQQTPVVVAVTPDDRIPEAFDCQHPVSFKVADMCHSSEGNKVAAAGAIFSFVVMLAAFASLYYAKRSADSAERSALAGQQSATAALAAVEVAQRASDAEVRPWLAINARLGSKVVNSDSSGTKLISIRVDVELKNIGNTPALNVWLYGAIDVPTARNLRTWARDVRHEMRCQYLQLVEKDEGRQDAIFQGYPYHGFLRVEIYPEKLKEHANSEGKAFPAVTSGAFFTVPGQKDIRFVSITYFLTDYNEESWDTSNIIWEAAAVKFLEPGLVEAI